SDVFCADLAGAAFVVCVAGPDGEYVGERSSDLTVDSEALCQRTGGRGMGSRWSEQRLPGCGKGLHGLPVHAGAGPVVVSLFRVRRPGRGPTRLLQPAA